MGSRDEKDKTKVRKEKLAGYFFNLSQLTFTGTGVGGIAPILQGEFGVKNYVVIIFGIVMTFIFAGIANRICKILSYGSLQWTIVFLCGWNNHRWKLSCLDLHKAR